MHDNVPDLYIWVCYFVRNLANEVSSLYKINNSNLILGPFINEEKIFRVHEKRGHVFWHLFLFLYVIGTWTAICYMLMCNVYYVIFIYLFNNLFRNSIQWSHVINIILHTGVEIKFFIHAKSTSGGTRGYI